ncbi:MAG: anthranilate synthase component I [Candidatus Nanopelagicus sp.]|nr:anthranilate synthase component I [Candidatus Nanopelagicus sp.]
MISLVEFRDYARNFNVIPVSRKLTLKSQTPLSIYQKLTNHRSGTFLLESAEAGIWARYSFIGVNSEATLTEENGLAVWQGVRPAGAPTGIDPLTALRITTAHLRSPKIEGLPPLTGGLVGYLGYEIVRRLEKLPNHAKADIKVPEIAMMLTSDLAVFDHQEGVVTLIANAINWDGSSERVDLAYESAISRLDKMESDLNKSDTAKFNSIPDRVTPKFFRNTSDETYIRKVELIKEQIKSGEAFQVVLSQRFTIDSSADSFDIYRVLREQNPSPYMYLFRFADGLSIVGSSPEALVKVSGDQVMIHPIAGTRARNSDDEIDNKMAQELLADPKERAEHLMLVDLGRNDLGRVCQAGSVEVSEFMQIEKYSHVMHIVSTVIGKLADKVAPIEALFAVFPAGTLSGAPKPRAMAIIEENEPTRRGIYGGTIGYLDFTGNIDTCIAIRTAVVKDGTAYVQAGAGIVADSDPASENQECINKAAAVLGAIATANLMMSSK